MHVQSVRLYHDMFVYVCATGGCFSCYSALRSNSLVSRKIATQRHLNII